MKKLLLSLSVSFFVGSLSAQVITSENFDSFFTGNVGTDFTGMTPTNNIYTLSTNDDTSTTVATTSTNAGNDNYQIVASDATHINALQITGTNGSKGRRQLWFDGFTDAWDFRDAGNDIIEAEFDMYTGAGGGASKNRTGLYIYNADRTKILGGFSYQVETRVISGVAYYDATATAGGMITNYLFYLGTGSTNITLAANTWVRLGVSFNKTTGQVIWKGPGINGQVPGAATAVDPDRVSFVSQSGSTTTTPIVTNAAASTLLFDNFIVKASATDTLLAVNKVSNVTAFSVFPNPATTVINVSNTNNSPITGISIADVNGRIVKQNAFGLSNVAINIGDLSSGIYMMTITSKEGTTVKKIIKN